MDLQVFSDFGMNDIAEKNTSKRKETRKRSRSRSPQQKVESQKEEYANLDISIRQMGDLYCKMCNCHTNSDEMWEKHIKGKRHLKNLRKEEPVEQKYENTNEELSIRKELDKETRPIAGLNHICEILRFNQPSVYECFLCSSNFATPRLVMEHIMGLKHQMTFLKENDKEKYYLLESSKLSKSNLEPIVQDLIWKYEQEHGRGEICVKKGKKKPLPFLPKKKADKDGDKWPFQKSSWNSPPPKSSRYSPPKHAKYSPPKYAKYSPPKPSRYSPPKSSRYSPFKSSWSSPPKYSRFSSLKSSRYSTPQSPRYSSPKSVKMNERQSESEWKDSPVRERSRDRKFPEKSHYCDEKEWNCYEPGSPICKKTSIRDSKLERGMFHSRAEPAFLKQKNYSDLREVLEENRNIGMNINASKANRNGSAFPSNVTDVSEDLLRLLDDTSLEEFLWLALYKLDNVVVKESIELKLLNRVSDAAVTLTTNAKKQFQTQNLKEKFKESLVRNSKIIQDKSMADASSQKNLRCVKNLDTFFEHHKDRKAAVYEKVYSTRVKSSKVHIEKKPMSGQQLNENTPYENSSEITVLYDSGLNREQSNFSSESTCIPVLVSTENLSSQTTTTTVVSKFTQNRQKYVWKRQ